MPNHRKVPPSPVEKRPPLRRLTARLIRTQLRPVRWPRPPNTDPAVCTRAHPSVTVEWSARRAFASPMRVARVGPGICVSERRGAITRGAPRDQFEV